VQQAKQQSSACGRRRPRAPQLLCRSCLPDHQSVIFAGASHTYLGSAGGSTSIVLGLAFCSATSALLKQVLLHRVLVFVYCARSNVKHINCRAYAGFTTRRQLISHSRSFAAVLTPHTSTRGVIGKQRFQGTRRHHSNETTAAGCKQQRFRQQQRCRRGSAPAAPLRRSRASTRPAG